MNTEIIHGVYHVYIVKIPLQIDNTFNGFNILTNKQLIKILIDDYNLLYEKSGILMFKSENIQNLIGLTILSISYGTEIDERLVPMPDISLNTHPHIIINIETDKGLIQIVIYNKHDGSCPHHAYIEWDNEFKYQIL